MKRLLAQGFEIVTAPTIQSNFMEPSIAAYNNAMQSNEEKTMCHFLAELIDAYLPQAECKIWHAHPVWFLKGNPIVGYSKQKCGINLLFWSGQSFEEPLLQPKGKFKAAVICYNHITQIKKTTLKRWLHKAQKIQWDYKNIVQRKGLLEKLF